MVSYAIVDKGADGGVMITASHNPPRYNGIKLKAAYGGSASAEDAKAVEQRLPLQSGGSGTAAHAFGRTPWQWGLVERFDPFPAYGAHLRTLVDFELIRRAAPAVVVDAMYGAGRIYLRRLLGRRRLRGDRTAR